MASIWSGGEDELRVGPNFGSFRQFEPELEAPLPLVAPGKASVAGVAPVFPETAAEGEFGPPESDEISTIIQNPTELPAEEGAVATGSDEETVLVERMPPASLGATAAAAAQTARLYFTGPGQINSGEEFVLEAYVEGVSDLFSAPLMVTYDSSKLALLRAEEGDLLKREGQPTLFSTSASPGKGEIFIAGKQAQGGTGASGSGCLFRLHFSARSAGPANVAMERTNFRTTAGVPLAVATSPFALAVR
ncbi:MAG: cohesin domain-containing protein [Desulfuromonadaceae bacterium]